MGNRDIRTKKARKPKKDARKAIVSTAVPTPIAVEVVPRKPKKEASPEEA